MARLAKYKTEAEVIEARRERQKARYQAMTLEQKQDYARRKNAKKRRMPQMVIESSRHMASPLQPKIERESVEAYLQRGGRIETI